MQQPTLDLDDVEITRVNNKITFVNSLNLIPIQFRFVGQVSWATNN